MTAKKRGSISLNVIGQRWREALIMIIEPPVAFNPSLSLLSSKLLTEVFANERVGIEHSIVRIFPCKEPCAS